MLLLFMDISCSGSCFAGAPCSHFRQSPACVSKLFSGASKIHRSIYCSSIVMVIDFPDTELYSLLFNSFESGVMVMVRHALLKLGKIMQASKRSHHDCVCVSLASAEMIISSYLFHLQSAGWPFGRHNCCLGTNVLLKVA